LNRRQLYLKIYIRKKIERVNGLSKRPDWKVGIENDNSNKILIKK